MLIRRLVAPIVFLAVAVLGLGSVLNVSVAPFLRAPSARCSEPNAARKEKIQNVTIRFDCGVDVKQQDVILRSTEAGLTAMPPGVSPSAELFAFADLDHGLKIAHSWLMERGYASSLQAFRADWEARGLIGETFNGGIFIHVRGPGWFEDPSRSTRMTVLHELHHLLQDEYLRQAGERPIWLIEGAAVQFAVLEQTDLGYPSSTLSTGQYACDFDLEELQAEDEAIPPACYYVQGARAVELLLDQYGKQPYYDILREMGEGRSFGTVFSDIYGFSLGNFYRRFDNYRNSGYKRPPALPLRHPVRLTAP